MARHYRPGEGSLSAAPADPVAALRDALVEVTTKEARGELGVHGRRGALVVLAQRTEAQAAVARRS
jgi:hypothetical protein